MQTIFALQVLYGLAVGFIKISIVVMLMRIFITPQFRLVAFCVMALSFMWMVMTILAGLLLCHPIKMNWDPQTPGGRCGNQYAAFVTVAAVDVFNEILLLLLPLPMVLNLHIGRRYKIGLACVFCSGILYVVVVSLLSAQKLMSSLQYNGRCSNTNPAPAKNGLHRSLIRYSESAHRSR